MFVVTIVLIFSLSSCRPATCSDGNFYARPGVSPGEILRARGFLVREHYVVSEGGYKLRVTQADNPAIKNANRDPILFVHGVIENDSIFVINSKNVSPKDFSNLRLEDEKTVNETILQDPSSRALPILALQFGHTVFILSRRGFPGSQQRLGDPNTIDPETDLSQPPDLSGVSDGLLTSIPGALVDYGNLPAQVRFTLNRNYWNFSYDEQAQFDYPKVIDFVLEQTGRPRLAIVSHSTGATLILAALTTQPKLADKISANILWAEGLSLGHGDIFNPLVIFEGLFSAYLGPIPPSFSSTQIQAFVSLLCAKKILQRTLCEGVGDLILGPSGFKEPITAEYFNTLLYPTASHEFAQNEQCVKLGKRMHMFDYGKERNMRLYNQTKPPLYDASKITLDRMSFYTSKTDQLVSFRDVEATISQLTGKSSVEYLHFCFQAVGARRLTGTGIQFRTNTTLSTSCLTILATSIMTKTAL